MLSFTTIRLVIQTSQVSKVDVTAFESKQFTTTHNTIHTEGCVCSQVGKADATGLPEAVYWMHPSRQPHSEKSVIGIIRPCNRLYHASNIFS